MNKGELRARMRQARRALSEAAQQEAAQAAAARILSLEAYRQARVVMAYMAVRGELALDAVLRDALETGKTLAENGLEVVETVCEVSTRLIVNIASLKLRKTEIEEIVGRLNAAKEAGA